MKHLNSPPPVSLARSRSWASKQGEGFIFGCVFMTRPKRIAQAYRHSTKMIDQIKRRAIRLDMECNLDREWVLSRLLVGKCEVTGVEFDFDKHGDHRRFNRLAPSIDRISSSHGYTKGNSQIVIAHYNFAKGQWTAEELEHLALAIINRKKER